MKRSKFLKLQWWDVVKGALVAGVTTLITALIMILNNGEIPLTMAEWKPILIAALASFLGYILKNWLTNNEGKIGKPDNKVIWQGQHKSMGVPDTTKVGKETDADQPTNPGDVA